MTDRQTATAADWIRILLCLLGSVGQILGAFAPELFGLTESISSRAGRSASPLIPAGYAFAIWLVIFLGCAVYALVQILPRYRTDARFRAVGWCLALATLANTVWEVFVPLAGNQVVTAVLLFVILAPLVAMMLAIRRLGSALVFLPLTIFAGWVSIAATVSLSLALEGAGLVPPAPASLWVWLGVLVTGGLGVLWLAARTGSFGYGFAVIWGLVAVALANFGGVRAASDPAIAYTAIALAVGTAIAAITGRIVLRRR